MTTSHEVISAFLDDEAYEPAALEAALADPAGRALLLDLLALRKLVQPADGAAASAAPRLAAPPSRAPWWLAAAAASALVVGGAWWVSDRNADRKSDRPPVADRIIKLQRGVDWVGN